MDSMPPGLVASRQLTPTLRLVRELGHGGMGRVWLADHLSLRTQVAVKVLTGRSARQPEAIARFSAEAAAAAKIRSAHVVQVFDHGFSDDMPYIVMELLEGEDLSRRLERERLLPPAEVLTIVRHVCKALERAHAMGIVHRDIKPANVFLVSGMGETFAKVLDFGLAKQQDGALSEMTASGAVFGTPYYVSPEQAQSARTVTAQSDLWSVGVLAYECLTGRRPFEAQSLMGLCLALNTGRFAPATTTRPELPAAVDGWFTRAFKRDPAARFTSAGELAATLAAALSEAAVTTDSSEKVTLVPSRTTWSHTLGGMRVARRAWRPVALLVAAAALLGWLLVHRLAPPSAADPSPSTALAVESRPLPLTSPATATVTASSPPAAVSNAPEIAAPPPRPLTRPAAGRPRPSVASAVTSDDLFSDPKH